MALPTKFVFYDRKQKRWRKVKKTIGVLSVLAGVAAIGSLVCVLYVPRVNLGATQNFSQKPKDLINLLSTREKETIKVDGYGPLILSATEKGEPRLLRQNFEKEKVVILTFDDGPDPIFTPKILKILKKENVKATFFVVGKQLFRHPNLAKMIVEDGHEIGAHTFSHPSEEMDLYSQQDKMSFELDFSQKLIQVQTGYKTKLFRVPNWGVEDTISLNSLVSTTYALARGYTVVGSTIDSFDWKEKSKEKIIQNSVNLNSSQAILMHDGGGNRNLTVAALPSIIKHYKDAGYQFQTVDALLKHGETATAPAGVLEKAASKVSFFLFWLKINFTRILDPIFKASLIVIATGVLVTILLSLFDIIQAHQKKRKKKKVFTPFVSVLVPAFNEEKTIGKTLLTLLNSDYPDFEIIVINNNSTDRTKDIVSRFLKNDKVRLLHEKKQGKCTALNKGIAAAKGKILVTIDADTQVLPNTIREIVQPLSNPKVGAVAGNLKVGNLVNSLTAFQAVEYIVDLNLDRRAYNVLKAVPIVPGALGAWRKKAVKKVHGYKGDTLTEDADLTIRIQKAGYLIVFSDDAMAYTETPENISAFLKQRLRWTLGILQVLYKHKDMFFKPQYGLLGMIVLPYIGLIQLPLMLISPTIDLLALIFLVYLPGPIILAFSGFLILKYVLTTVAFIFGKETKVWLLVFLPLARIIYQGIWYYTLYRSVLVALKGTYVPWKKMVHKGSVTL